MLPTISEARALHEKYAPTREALDLVYTHCEIICRIAEQLMARTVLQLDPALVRAGALLHDIGVYRLYDHAGRLDHGDYIRHGILGHEILRQEGFPERPRRFCSWWTSPPATTTSPPGRPATASTSTCPGTSTTAPTRPTDADIH